MMKIETILNCVIGYVAFMGMILFLSGMGGGYADPLVDPASARKSLEETQEIKMEQMEDMSAMNSGMTMGGLASVDAMDESGFMDSIVSGVKNFMTEQIKHVLDEMIKEKYMVSVSANTQGEGQ
jgi:hypothetical protein